MTLRRLPLAAALLTGSAMFAAPGGALAQIDPDQTLTNGSFTIEIDGRSGAIQLAEFGGRDFFNPGTPVSHFGFQTSDFEPSFAYNQNPNEGDADIPVRVWRDGDTVNVRGTFEGFVPVKGITVDQPVEFLRQYSIPPGTNVLHIETILVNTGSTGTTVRYFDTYDPDQGSPEGGEKVVSDCSTTSTFNDVTSAFNSNLDPVGVAIGVEDLFPCFEGGPPKTLPGEGLSVALVTDNLDAVLSAGSCDGLGGSDKGLQRATKGGGGFCGEPGNAYFEISDGEELNWIYDNPGDGDQGFEDLGLHIVFEETIAPGSCVTVGYDMVFATTEVDLFAIVSSSPVGGVASAPLDCVLPEPPPPPPVDLGGLIAMGDEGDLNTVNHLNGNSALATILDCIGLTLKGGPGEFDCDFIAFDIDHATSIGYAVVELYEFIDVPKGGPGEFLGQFLYSVDMADGSVIDTVPISPPFAKGNPGIADGRFTDIEWHNGTLWGAYEVFLDEKGGGPVSTGFASIDTDGTTSPDEDLELSPGFGSVAGMAFADGPDGTVLFFVTENIPFKGEFGSYYWGLYDFGPGNDNELILLSEFGPPCGGLEFFAGDLYGTTPFELRKGGGDFADLFRIEGWPLQNPQRKGDGFLDFFFVGFTEVDDCVALSSLPTTAGPGNPLTPGLYASSFGVEGPPASIFDVDLVEGEFDFRGELPCNGDFFFPKGFSPPPFFCGAMDIDYDNAAGVGYAVSFPFFFAKSEKIGIGFPFPSIQTFDMETVEPIGSPKTILPFLDGEVSPAFPDLLPFVTDIEVLSDGRLLAMVAFEDFLPKGEDPPSPGAGETWAGILDPATGFVDLIEPLDIPPFTAVTAMAEIPAGLVITKGSGIELFLMVTGELGGKDAKLVFGSGESILALYELGSGSVFPGPPMGENFWGLEFGGELGETLYGSSIEFDAPPVPVSHVYDLSFILSIKSAFSSAPKGPPIGPPLASIDDFISGLAWVGDVPPSRPESTLVIGAYFDDDFYEISTFDASIDYISTLECSFEKGDVAEFCGMEDFDIDNDTGTGYAISSPFLFKSGDRAHGRNAKGRPGPQAGVRFDLETGDFIGDPVELTFDLGLPPKGNGGGLEVEGVTDIEIVDGTYLVAVSVASFDIGKQLEDPLILSTIGVLDPATGLVTASFDDPDNVIEAHIFGIAADDEGVLYVVSDIHDDPGKLPSEDSLFWRIGEFGFEFIDTLPGIGFGLEFDLDGRLYYATDFGPFGEGELYEVVLGESDPEKGGPTSLAAFPVFIGEHGLAVGGLALRIGEDEEPPVDPGSCECPGATGAVDSADGRFTEDETGGEQDRFGQSVALCGDTAVIGSPSADDLGSSSGAVTVASHDGATTYSTSARLTASDGSSGDYFGYSVEMSGDSIIVGAPLRDAAGSTSGGAYIYTRGGTKGAGSGEWSEEAILLGSEIDHFDKSGWSVDICNDTAIVGAPNASSRGAATIFVRGVVKGGSGWTEEVHLTAADASGGDSFGDAVAIDGDIAVVGSPGDDDAGSSSGSVYVFFRELGVWSSGFKINAADGGSGDRFGAAVDICEDNIVVGAPGEDEGATNSGAVYVFKVFGPGSVVETSKLKADVPQANAQLGYSGVSVSCTSDILFKGVTGGTLFVGAGAPYDDDGDSNAGAAHLFMAPEAVVKGPVPGGVEVAKYVAEFPTSNAYNGTDVSISGLTLMSGAPLARTAPWIATRSSRVGAAYFFQPGAPEPPK